MNYGYFRRYRSVHLFAVATTLMVAAICGSSATSQAASPSGTTIPNASQLVDSSGNIWTVSGGVVYENGKATPSTQVSLLLYYQAQSTLTT
jgi:hypothetical protein